MQLRRMAAAMPSDTVWASTDRGLSTEVAPARFHTVPDANRWNRFALAWSALRILLVVLRVRPTHVVTTGAAPGWLAVVFARLLGARTLWIDSIANAEEISLSGRKARRWAHEVWTQWPELVEPPDGLQVEVKHYGSVL